MAAVAEAGTTADVVAALEDQEMSLADLRAVVDDKAIGRAWAAGVIEFGRPGYCVQSPQGGEQSVMILEGGCDWSKAKTDNHKPFSGILKEAESLPVYGRYERADVPLAKKTDPRTGAETFHRPIVTHAEAQRLTGLRVRLTDKGLASLGE